MAVEHFVTLPDNVRQPEGLTINPASGELFVGTFDAREPDSARNNQLLRYSRDGKLLGSKPFGPTPLTGIAFRDDHIYVLNFGTAQLQRIAAAFDAQTPVQVVLALPRLAPTAPAPRSIANPDGSSDVVTFGSTGMAAPNGMVFDSRGNLYVSDSFQGAILRIEAATSCSRCVAEVVSRNPMLATAGALPFGANGLAFDPGEQHLYITNAGDGRLLRMNMADRTMQVVAESLPGADGLLFHGGLFWVAANQIDHVVAVNAAGRAMVIAGGFQGINADGTPRGLLFPASTVADGSWMFVTNLALPLTPATGDEWEEEVARWSIARFRIPESGSR
ncbi:MAG: hypothetical protein ABW278_15140 [Steroidobacteraceae bacterium]